VGGRFVDIGSCGGRGWRRIGLRTSRWAAHQGSHGAARC
jgi:hypothetical protein